MANREEFLKRLRKTFKIEAEEGIAHITSSLIELEKGTPAKRQDELVEAVFRDAHSLKGAARAVNFTEIETVCQALEGVFSELKNNAFSLTPELFDLFHQTVNLLSGLLQDSSGEADNANSEKVKSQIYLLQNVSGQTHLARPKPSREESSPKDVPPKEQPLSEAGSDAEKRTVKPKVPDETVPLIQKTESTIRISIEKLDNLLNQAEEMQTLKQSLSHINNNLVQIGSKLDILNHENSVVSSKHRDALGEADTAKAAQAAAGYFDWATSMMKAIGNDLEVLSKHTVNEGYSSGVKVEALIDDVKKIISVPFSLILDGFPKAARDLSKDRGKKVKVEVTGSELEIDRRILEELRNPFIHLLRNTIDHGVEKPEIRIQKEKPETGMIKISVEQLENNHMAIIFSDDGAGIELEKVRQKYIRQEDIPRQEWKTITENTLINYLFKSGFSTTELITDISGRGLGLSIVQEKVEQLGGTVSVKTVKDAGTEFRIEVPLSLVTFRGVIVKVGEFEFVVPTSKINRIVRIEKTTVKTVENKQVFQYEDTAVPLVFLSSLLEIPGKETEADRWPVMLLGMGNNQIGFVIDAIVDEELVMSKKFNSQMKRVRNISGATVLGSGKVLPILNVSDLLKSATKQQEVKLPEPKTEKKKSSVLVVEDSITSRMLLKNILETAGYDVLTATDGIDGYTRLRESVTDLVISDVDMPRMNGFDMTAKIRSDKDLSEVPVVLVTSLSKREDRERGLEVGANAYIVKSNFDQSNLLEVVERLLN